MKAMKNLLFFFFFVVCFSSNGQIVLQADRVFDGEKIHMNWSVVVEKNMITYVGPTSALPSGVSYEFITLKNKTLMPGLIEGHSHLLLHPYNETSWNDQVLKESPVERAVRATVHAKSNLLSGITTMRDLGSEGAGYTDIYLKKTIEEGIIVGPRLIVAGPAIVATGAYGPKGFHDGVVVPLGAEPASGIDEVIKTVRTQIGNGADFIKIYSDYRWSPGQAAQPTFLQEEINAMVQTAKSAGTYVIAHASTPEGMKRAILGGVETIEHGDGATPEILKLMKDKGVALCPTLAAGDAIERYAGWDKNTMPDTERILNKKKSFQLALEANVSIVFGGDVGVFSHGENYRELELMVAYGMNSLEVLKSATSGNAKRLHLDTLGHIKQGFLADIIAVENNPIENIKAMQNVVFVMKDGVIYKNL